MQKSNKGDKMKKRVLIYISIIIILIIIYITLIRFEIVLNPLIDNSDLICTRESLKNKEVYTFDFDWLSNLKNTDLTNYIYFDNKTLAEQYLLKVADRLSDKSEISISENSVIIINKGVNHFDGNKKYIKEYLTDCGFECR